MEDQNSSLGSGEETVGQGADERTLHLPRPVLEHIFSYIGPYELAVAANVCRTWYAATKYGRWQEFYTAFWPAPLSLSSDPMRWRQAFCQRMLASRSLRGRPVIDHLIGHNSGVRVAKIVPNGHDLLLTGSVDRRLILWDLKTGTQLDASTFHAGTVRCLALDDNLLATGSSDQRIRVWSRWREEDRIEGSDEEDYHGDVDGVNNGNGNGIRGHQMTRQLQRMDDFPFRVDGPRVVLSGGHTGPVSALQMCPTALFSGSWDYCVRVWDRTACQVDGSSSNIPSSQWPQLNCTQVLHFDDWVMDMSLKKDKLYVASGEGVHVVDAGQGGGLMQISELRHHHHTAIPIAAVTTVTAGAEDGHMIYYGTTEGGVFPYDTRSPATQQQKPYSCSSAVTGLSWEYPWLAASLLDGEVMLLNTINSRKRMMVGDQTAGMMSRILNPGTTRAGGAQCVDLNGLAVVAGFESGTVVSWDFHKAEESERIAQEMRAGRRKARERRRAGNIAQRRLTRQPAGRGDASGRPNVVLDSQFPAAEERQPDLEDVDLPAMGNVPSGWQILRRP
jgi:WD40 repeat protein